MRPVRQERKQETGDGDDGGDHDGCSNALYNDVVCWNNTGAVHLTSGDLAGASQAFASALQALKRSVSGRVANERDGTQTFTRLVPRIQCTFVRQDLDETLVRSFAGEIGSKNSEGFVYASPLVLSRPMAAVDDHGIIMNDDELQEESHLVRIMSFSVVYNLALCRDLAGMHPPDSPPNNDPRSCTKRRFHLQQAVQLYTQAKSLLSLHYCDDSGDQRGILHGLAILNNLGRIYFRLGDSASAKQHFECLFKAIVAIQTTRMTTSGYAGSSRSSSSHHDPRYDQDRGSPSASWCRNSSESLDEEQIAAAMDGFLSNIFAHWMGSPDNAPAA